MTRIADRPFDWIAALACALGAGVVIPSLTVLGISVVAVILTLL